MGGINQAQRRIVTAGVMDRQQSLSQDQMKIKKWERACSRMRWVSYTFAD
ncbi:hypothetical protein C4J83_5615 [Pseudomonas sp. LBUM920]|nr:hypothetical protein C4J83_5615 [Pseudomonas sp. LBUM920]